MGLVTSVREKRAHPRSPSIWMERLFGGVETATGRVVDADIALTISAVYAAVRFLAETIASLPLPTFEKLEPRGKKRDFDHPLYELLHDQPNRWQDSMEWVEMMQGHLSLRGNAYSQILRSTRQIEELIPLHPDRVTPRWGPPGAVWYEYRPPTGQTRVFLEDEMFHLRGWSSNGLKGMSPVALARESLGLSLAAEEVGARFFGNNSVPKGVLQHPNTLDDEAVKRLRESWEGQHRGLEESSRVAILEEGMEWKQVGLSAEDAQFLQTRNFQIDEVARWFNVPPHIIRKLDKSSFSNIEQQSLEVVMYTLRPIAVRWEKAIRRSLYTEADKKTHATKFVLDALLRGDFKTRWEGYAIGKQNGILNADEIRELEDINPQPDGIGEVYFVPLNMIPADQATQEIPSIDVIPDGPVDAAREKRAKEQRAKRSITERRRLQQAHRPLFKDAATRFLRREIKAVERMAKKFLPDQRGDFADAVALFYEQHRVVIEQIIGPSFRVFASAIGASAATEVGADPADLERLVKSYTDKFAQREARSSMVRLQQDSREAEEPDVAVQERLDEWELTRADRIAMSESIELDGAISRATYIAAGVFLLRWVTIGDNCPLCHEMSGRVVGVEQNFLNAGDVLNAEGTADFKTSRTFSHPPLHGGCDCMITAG